MKSDHEEQPTNNKPTNQERRATMNQQTNKPTNHQNDKPTNRYIWSSIPNEASCLPHYYSEPLPTFWHSNIHIGAILIFFLTFILWHFLSPRYILKFQLGQCQTDSPNPSICQIHFDIHFWKTEKTRFTLTFTWEIHSKSTFTLRFTFNIHF